MGPGRFLTKPKTGNMWLGHTPRLDMTGSMHHTACISHCRFQLYVQDSGAECRPNTVGGRKISMSSRLIFQIESLLNSVAGG